MLICIALVGLIGCNTDKETAMKPSPIFYSNDSPMVEVKGRLGILGPDFIANQVNKYMWHFWGTKEELALKPFRVEAINMRMNEKVMALVTNSGTPREEHVWEYSGLGGPNNGADAHIPSSLQLPSSGQWQLNTYLGGKFFGAIIVDVMEKNL
ncbi:DUF4871 domain-containing protein [Paenibacillus sp. N1-5-1-14]|nr:DUF4871 domain-containing protein [Paenibacillus radicibacter]